MWWTGPGALPRLVDDAAVVLELHERGEHAAGRWLEPGWAALRAGLDDRRATLMLRAVRDLIADCSLTLPRLLDHGRPQLLHAWFASFDGPRAALHPGLADAYAAWAGGDEGAALCQACAWGESHFSAQARTLLALADGGDQTGLVAQLAQLAQLARIALPAPAVPAVSAAAR